MDGVAADFFPGGVEETQLVVGIGDKNRIAEVLDQRAIAALADLQFAVDFLLFGEVDIDAVQLQLIQAVAQHQVAGIDPHQAAVLAL